MQPVTDQISPHMCVLKHTGFLLDRQSYKFLHADIEDSDQNARMRRLFSLRWVYMSEDTFSHVVVYLLIRGTHESSDVSFVDSTRII